MQKRQLPVLPHLQCAYIPLYNKEYLNRITDAYTYTFALQTRKDKGVRK